MTTIAYRDGILAADGQATRGEMRVDSDVRKLRRLRDGSLAGITGAPGVFESFVGWLNEGAKGQSPTISGNATVMHLRADGSLRVYEDGGYTDEPTNGFRAWGSGHQVALGAMAHGATAEQAVRIASQFDIWSGGRIQVASLKRKPLTQRQADAIVRKYRRGSTRRPTQSATKQ